MHYLACLIGQNRKPIEDYRSYVRNFSSLFATSKAAQMTAMNFHSIRHIYSITTDYYRKSRRELVVNIDFGLFFKKRLLLIFVDCHRFHYVH